ncbi:hypothetical protein LCGC14_0270780 [marine sediment metagenome]|uniref:ATP-grasp domain-containing protein n=1 Tax=marine sediment metagenome TaxID=412755 RepID=A0A0F9U3M5_9ZZZZ
MSHLYYRLTKTEDPEERLEDAVLYKAMHDTFGKGLTMVDMDEAAPMDGLFLGRGKNRELWQTNQLANPGLKYWEDPAFKNAITRSFVVTDLSGAEKEVKRLHAEGKSAFLKSTKQKHYFGRVDLGQTLHDALDGMVYSFMDIENCLMVQQAMDMSYERRFLVMNGKVVTQSPVAWHLTPMSRSWVQEDTGFSIEDMHYKTPQGHEARFSPEGTERMTKFAQHIADASDNPHLCIDLAIIGDDPSRDPIELIEFNPMQPGAVGLYGCDPKKVAGAVWDAMDPELRSIVAARKDGLTIEDPEPRITGAEMVENLHPFTKNIFANTPSQLSALAEDYDRLHGAEGDTLFEDEIEFEDEDFTDNEPEMEP